MSDNTNFEEQLESPAEAKVPEGWIKPMPNIPKGKIVRKLAKNKLGKKLGKMAERQLLGVFISGGALNAWYFKKYILLGLSVLFFLIIVFLHSLIESQKSLNSNQPVAKVTTLGPNNASSGDNIEYKITVQRLDLNKGIIITDQIPESAKYVNSIPTGNFNPLTRKIIWILPPDNTSINQNSENTIQNNILGASTNNNITLRLFLRMEKDDNKLNNLVSGSNIK